MENAAVVPASVIPESPALQMWEFEGGALRIVTRAAAVHALRMRIELATRRRDMLSYRVSPEGYLAADSIVSALEAQLEAADGGLCA